MTDKRRSHRLKIELPASFEVKTFTGKQISIASTLDISATGFCLVCKEKPSVGDKLEVNVELPDGERLVVKAAVVWVKLNAGYGGTTEYLAGLRIREPLTEDGAKFIRFYATKLLEFSKQSGAK